MASPSADAARARELFTGLVGRRTGIVRQVALVDTMDGDAPLCFGPRGAESIPITAALKVPGIAGAAVDLTPPWAASLGLQVARVVIPDLMPLHGNHPFRYLDHPRLARATACFPRARLLHERPDWPYPHPMP